MVKNEAVWALSNCTSSANPQQFKILVDKGIIKALGGILKHQEVKMLAVALEGLENVLSCGQKHYLDENGENTFSILMEQEGALDDLENLQTHPNHTIYQSALKIIDKFFNEEDQGDPLMSAINQVQSHNGT